MPCWVSSKSLNNDWRHAACIVDGLSTHDAMVGEGLRFCWPSPEAAGRRIVESLGRLTPTPGQEDLVDLRDREGGVPSAGDGHRAVHEQVAGITGGYLDQLGVADNGSGCREYAGACLPGD